MNIKTNLSILGSAGISSNEPDYKEFIQDPGLRRRMSRVIRMSVASAIMALKDAGVESIDAIVTGTGWGCLADTEKFLISIIQNEERLLNPSSFIQSTSNTVGAQIALMRGDKHYNNTYVHGSSSFESALLDASLLTSEGSKCVLVGGFDELTPTKKLLLGRMGMWRHHKSGEGAAFFVLSPSPGINRKGVITSLEFCPLHEDFEGLLKRIVKLNSPGTLFLCGYDELIIALKDLGCRIEGYKVLTGEYPTASASALLIALERLSSENSIEKIILINKYSGDAITIIELSR